MSRPEEALSSALIMKSLVAPAQMTMQTQYLQRFIYHYVCSEVIADGNTNYSANRPIWIMFFG